MKMKTRAILGIVASVLAIGALAMEEKYDKKNGRAIHECMALPADCSV